MRTTTQGPRARSAAANAATGACAVYIVSSPVSEQTFAARPLVAIVQTTTVLVISIRRKNPRCVDRASPTTRL
jgi:hypothetical protein